MMLKQTLGYIPVNLANIIVSFGTIAILTRLFSGAEFGRYALAVASMHFIHMGLFAWMEAAMARFYARAERKGNLASHLKTLYVGSAVMGATALPLLLLGVYILPLDGPLKTVLMFALSSTCLTLIYNLGIESHKAAHRIGRYSGIHASQSLIGFSIGILLILITPLREAAPFVGIICANIVALIIDLPFMLRKMKGGRVQPRRTASYFKYGLPICLSLMLAYLLSQGDLFFIAYFMGEASVGQYNAGYNLANRSLDVLFIWMGMAVTPLAITTLEHEGLEAAKAVLHRYGATLLLIILPAATGIALVAEPAGFILGESVRAEAVSIMPWIAVAGVLNGLIAYYAQPAFVLSRKTGALAVLMVVPVILNMAMNIMLIPAMGLMGAVYATIAAYALGLVLALAIARKYFPLPLPLAALFKCGFACAVMAGIVFALPVYDGMPDFVELIYKASIGAAVYGLTVFAVNGAECRDLVKDGIVKLKQRRAQPLPSGARL